MNIYIAGPMSGIPQYNFPAFFAAAKTLRDNGYEVVCPAEMDDEDDKGLAMKSPDGMGFARKTWGDFLMRDVKLVADVVDGVALLPGWHDSRGARLEAFIALTVQKPVFFIDKLGDLKPVSIPSVLKTITSYVQDQGNVDRYKEAGDVNK